MLQPLNYSKSYFPCIIFIWISSYVNIPGNEMADNVAENVIYLPHTSYNLLLPRSNLKIHYSSLSFNFIKPIPTKWFSSSQLNRPFEIAITRFPTGHIHLIHSHFISILNPPNYIVFLPPSL